ncbi:MAG: CHAP domain-containing protein [Spirochaetes bacterium]|nr:CHAP domain-containing protein [Spirochaetota bacterium]
MMNSSTSSCVKLPLKLNMKTKRTKLIEIAEKLALTPLHGKIMGMEANIAPIINHFPNPTLKEFNGKWCAAFVYHCHYLAGYAIPFRCKNRKIGTFAGVKAWLQWAKFKENSFYFSASNKKFKPAPGDIVIYDRVFDPGPHDHIGIILKVKNHIIRVAEGNVNNLSTIIERKTDSHVRGYIRIPDDYKEKN